MRCSEAVQTVSPEALGFNAWDGDLARLKSGTVDSVTWETTPFRRYHCTHGIVNRRQSGMQRSLSPLNRGAELGRAIFAAKWGDSAVLDRGRRSHLMHEVWFYGRYGGKG